MNNPFSPRYISESELSYFGLPSAAQQANIMSIVDGASALIDSYCGRTDGNGNGTLVYATYSERLLLQSPNRNIVYTSFKPMAAIDVTTAALIQASGAAVPGTLAAPNCYDTGFIPNTIIRPDGTLSSILSASGRYGYPRRGMQAIYPDLNYGMNLLQVAAFFGGPPNWVVIDVTGIDWDPITGEVWIPAGLYMGQYTEVVLTYNTGYNPLQMPLRIKRACALLVNSWLAQPAPVLKSMSAPGAMNVTFGDSMISNDIEKLLDPYKNVIAY